MATRLMWRLRLNRGTRSLSTSPKQRYVRMEGSKLDTSKGYPTPGFGHQFRMNIFGLRYSVDDINAVQDAVWDTTSFLPRRPAEPFVEGPLADLSDIAGKMAVVLDDGETPGLLAQNRLRSTVSQKLNDSHFVATMKLLQAFKAEPPSEAKTALGQQISDLAFWAQWLIRGVLFEGKLHWELFCQDAVRAPLSKIAFAANAALGRHQIEFVYDDYTLKAAQFPTNRDMDDVDYDDADAILNAVAQISTPVGFNDMQGGKPEHNFRHNHSLMEWQMRRAFRGTERILRNDTGGWDDVVEAARRANRVFHTMLTHTPPASYPAIRLPIKGVRGALGSVYHKHGVFYEGVGSDVYTDGDCTISGVYIDDEWGQTGANSSMYKYFDVLCGVTQARRAYEVDPIVMSKMAAVFEGRMDSASLGSNPIDSMQRAFDLFTRPPRHMRLLVDTERQLQDSGALDDNDPAVMLQRLRLAYWVADHRMTHGKYVLASIYRTEPVGGQSRAEGTGGSTPPFLKLFLDQTLGPGRQFVIQLLLRRDLLSESELDEVAWYASKFDAFEVAMEKVRSKGQRLEHEEQSQIQ